MQVHGRQGMLAAFRDILLAYSQASICDEQRCPWPLASLQPTLSCLTPPLQNLGWASGEGEEAGKVGGQLV